MTYPIIALLTDFGDRDWYVASIKGVISRLCPKAQLIDITHKIEPGSVSSAAFVLSQCYRDFPDGTTFLCVVDPGVGSSRRAIMQVGTRYRYVSPDNGLLSLIESDRHHKFEIDPRRAALESRKVSSTFHGRDLFAPAAARLAGGEDPRSLGEELPPPRSKANCRELDSLPAAGCILYFDRFGNAITNLRTSGLHRHPSALLLDGDLEIPFASCFSDVHPGKPLCYLGSGGFLEIAVNQGSAQDALKLSMRQSVTLR